MNNANPLEMMGVATILIVLGSIVIWKDDEGTRKRLINGMFLAAGLLFGFGILLAPSMASVRNFVQDLSIGGVNVALTGAIWAGLIAWFEGFKSSSRGTDYGGHHIRTPVTAAVAGMLVPLWVDTHLTLLAIGIMLVGITVILAVKAKGETPRMKRVTTIAAILAGLGIAADVGAYLGAFTRYAIWGIPVFFILPVALGLVLYYEVWHKRQNNYHHIRTTVFAVAFAVSVCILGGGTFNHMLNVGTHSTVTTVTHMSGHGGGGGNPFAPAGRDLNSAINKALHHHG
jgi:hypothetical protein